MPVQAVSRAWLAGRGGLPGETRAYVRAVTGHDAETWASEQPPQWEPIAIPKTGNCLELAKLFTAAPRAPRRPLTESVAWGPWGVQLAGNWSEGGVLAMYERLRRTYNPVLHDRLPLVLQAKLPGRRGAAKYIVRVSESSRDKADSLCTQLRAAGGACIRLAQSTGQRRRLDFMSLRKCADPPSIEDRGLPAYGWKSLKQAGASRGAS